MELGMYFALDDSQAKRLLDQVGTESLDDLLDEIEENDSAVLRCECDKAWDAILCALSPDGYERSDRTWPGHGVVLGERDLNVDVFDRLVSYSTPEAVQQVSDYLAGLSKDDFELLYGAMPEENRQDEYGTEECSYAWGWLEQVRSFFADAAEARLHVVFTAEY